MDYLSLGLRLFLAFVCLAAVAGKVRGRVAFAGLEELVGKAGVPAVWTTQAAVLLVATEFAVAALLPWPATALVGCVLATGLFAALTAGVAVVVRRGDVVPCRCFGRAGATLRASHVARNAALTAVAVAAGASVLGYGGEVGSAPGGVLAGVTAAAAAAVVVFWDDLAALVSADLVEVER
jgi:hypothetical protein